MSVIFFLIFIGLLSFGIFKAVVSPDHEISWKASRGTIYFLIAAVFLLISASFTTVDAGTIGVVTRFGRVNRPLYPGAHLILPFAESVHFISTQTQTVKPDEDASSNDLQIVHTQVTLAFHYDPNYAGYIYSQLGGDARESVVIPGILEAIKSLTAQYSANDLISKRPLVRDGIDDFVKVRLTQYHIVTETVSITDFHFSPDYENAIEAKVTAVQKAEQATNDLNRIKIEAEQKVAAAEGEANALKVQKEQITPELLQLRTIEMMNSKWDGHLPEQYYGGNAPLPMVDVFKARNNK